MRVLRILVIAMTGTALGCLEVSGVNSTSSCPVSAVISAGTGINDFKQRIAAQTAVAPADSVLAVVLIFASVATQADRDRVTAAGGTNVSTAGNANALKAQFRAQDLDAYVGGDTGRLADAVIYIPTCVVF